MICPVCEREVKRLRNGTVARHGHKVWPGVRGIRGCPTSGYVSTSVAVQRVLTDAREHLATLVAPGPSEVRYSQASDEYHQATHACYGWGAGLPRPYRTRYRDTVTGETIERWWCPRLRGVTSKATPPA